MLLEFFFPGCISVGWNWKYSMCKCLFIAEWNLKSLKVISVQPIYALSLYSFLISPPFFCNSDPVQWKSHFPSISLEELLLKRESIREPLPHNQILGKCLLLTRLRSSLFWLALHRSCHGHVVSNVKITTPNNEKPRSWNQINYQIMKRPGQRRPALRLLTKIWFESNAYFLLLIY